MRAYLLKKHGGPDSLSISEQPEPQPGKGEVKVAISHIGINYAEILSRRGQYGWAPKKPYIPGMEAFGTVEAVGEGVTLKTGAKVICGAQYGAYAEKVVVPEYMAFPAMPAYADEEQAALLVNYMTAWVALFKQARLQPYDTVLITAAAGGVGTAAVQLAKAYGCQVIGTASKAYKLDLIKKLGADAAINYQEKDWEAQVREASGGIDVVLELVGGDTFNAAKNLLNPFGRIVVAGIASIKWSPLNPLSWLPALMKVPRFSLREMAKGSQGLLATHIGYLIDNPELTSGLWAELSAFVNEHQIRPQVSEVFDFEKLAEAHKYIESRKSYGKVVLKV
ncbi:MAG: zinc-binding alcohol dehydrogenase family protein [Cyclobacteriaceae bacterium]